MKTSETTPGWTSIIDGDSKCRDIINNFIFHSFQNLNGNYHKAITKGHNHGNNSTYDDDINLYKSLNDFIETVNYNKKTINLEKYQTDDCFIENHNTNSEYNLNEKFGYAKSENNKKVFDEINKKDGDMLCI